MPVDLRRAMRQTGRECRLVGAHRGASQAIAVLARPTAQAAGAMRALRGSGGVHVLTSERSTRWRRARWLGVCGLTYLRERREVLGVATDISATAAASASVSAIRSANSSVV